MKPVLIIEDDSTVRNWIVRLLQEDGYAIEADDGTSARGHAHLNTYSCVVLDRGLSGSDGLHWLQQWRAQGSDVAVVMLTAAGDLLERRAGLQGGADAYLVKPAEPAELLATLRRLIRQGRPPRPAVEQWGPVAINRPGRFVDIDGVRISLGRRPFSVFEVLFNARGAVVNREEVLTLCWGEEGQLLGDPVNAASRAIRRELGNDLVRQVHGGLAIDISAV